MIRRKRLVAVAAVAGGFLALTATGSAAAPDDSLTRGGNFVSERLSPLAEIPVLSSGASGTFRASIDERAGEINWRLTYSDLSAPVTQAHIHFGSATHNGGISVFLCASAGTPPPGTQPCPPAPATVTGKITAAEVIGPATQGIAAGEFAELVRALRTGLTYANVHDTMFPAGEIRAQLGHRH